MAVGDNRVRHPPSGPLQVFPPGLLGFLQLKNVGRNPSELSDVLVPQLEVRDWLFNARAEELLATRTIVGNSNGTASWTTPTGGVVVPEREFWFIHEFCTFTEPLLAADTVVVAPAWKDGRATGPAQFIRGNWAAAVTGPNRRAFNPSSPASFFLPPGAELLLWHEVITATQVSVNGGIRFTRLPI